jgi:hypothetical protein
MAKRKHIRPGKKVQRVIKAETPLIAEPVQPSMLMSVLDPVHAPQVIGANKWPHQRDCLRMFGNPFTPGWANTHLVHVTPPYAVVMGNIHIGSIPINKIAADSLTRVLARIADACGHDSAQIAAGHCNCFSGSFALRNMRGLNTISMHAFGLAIDWDAGHNPLGAREESTFFKPNSLLVQAFKSEGWTWGGDWRGRRDAMHVQAAIVS